MDVDPSNRVEVVEEVKPAGMITREDLPLDRTSALEILMNEYGTTVLRTAFFYLGDRHLAEDVSQEVFIRAFRYWSDFRGKSSVKTWLTTITINVCKDKLALKSAKEQPTDPVLFQLTTHVGVEEQAMRRMRDTTILQHVCALPQHYHEVVYLYYYLELTTAEIAAAIGCPEGTVRGRLHRARVMLGQILQKEGLDDG